MTYIVLVTLNLASFHTTSPQNKSGCGTNLEMTHTLTCGLNGQTPAILQLGIQGTSGWRTEGTI